MGDLRSPVLAVLCTLALQTPAQTIGLQGRVVDESGTPLANVNVQLVGFDMETLTDASGHYRFDQGASAGQAIAASRPAPGFHGTRLTFTTDVEAMLRVEAIDLAGRVVARGPSDRFSAGTHTVDLASVLHAASGG